jgi:hypothetical protein
VETMLALRSIKLLCLVAEVIAVVVLLCTFRRSTRLGVALYYTALVVGYISMLLVLAISLMGVYLLP